MGIWPPPITGNEAFDEWMNIFYRRVASKAAIADFTDLASLANGAANLKVFMNAGATAPEWAAGMKVVSATFDLTSATGTWAITGAGFKPGAIIWFGSVVGSTDGWFIGMHTASVSGTMSYFLNGGVLTSAVSANFGTLYQTAGTYQYFNVSSLDADGATLSNTKANSPTGTLTAKFLFLR